MLKRVTHLLPAVTINMGGIPIKQAIPTIKVRQIDPFLLLHHGKAKSTNRKKAIHQGIGPHPHRGFSPVTFILDGEINHRDSRGNNQVAKQGEVQWINAGAGIIHSERPSKALAENGGTSEIIQLWINSPANKKMKQPFYQYHSEPEIPYFLSEDKQIQNKVISGEYNAIKGKFIADSELKIIWGKSFNTGTQHFSIPSTYNVCLYIAKGKLRIKGYGIVEKENLIVLTNEGSEIELHCEPDTQYLLLAGIPINEKVVQQGPFVMNSETEILEAMRDYQMGKMGILIEEDLP